MSSVTPETNAPSATGAFGPRAHMSLIIRAAVPRIIVLRTILSWAGMGYLHVGNSFRLDLRSCVSIPNIICNTIMLKTIILGHRGKLRIPTLESHRLTLMYFICWHG